MTNTKKVYYAHSEKDLPHEQWQTFSSHAENVAKLAAQFAEIFDAYQLAYNTGLLHDLGKYTPAFEKDAVIRNFLITADEDKNYNTKHYNISVIIDKVIKLIPIIGTQVLPENHRYL
ncbi:HD domain-containing protein [Basfia succiniciproducens]|uniref:HD domain-containing protein n=1 Tax=Basfia succiniciproducens TaxID=653940 RepID=UPI003FCDCB9F